MSKQIKTHILIKATPAQVWAVLTDFKEYPNWNPFIKTIQGNVQVGKKITVRIEPPDAQAMTFTPKVLVYAPQKELRWLGRLLFRGLFDGTHAFILIDNGDGTTTFKHEEEFKGILVPLFRKMLDNNTLRGFKLMNMKLKEQVEGN